MHSKINTYRSLLYLVDLDETEHIIKDIAQLFLSALRDWPTDTHQDIVKCIQEFKDYFGDPFTFVDGRIINIIHFPTYSSWRGEAGWAITKMIELSIQHFNTADFDVIVDRVLSHYEQKFLLTSKQKPLKSTGFADFTLSSNTLTEKDYKHWLGVEPDVFISPDNPDYEDTQTTWGISTGMTPNTVSSILVRKIVSRLIPIKDRVIALKQAHPDLSCELELVYWSNPLDSFLYMDKEMMLLLGEIGAQFHTEMFSI